VQDLSTDEMKFINFEIDGSKLDFEGRVTYQTTFDGW
jgi:hypothetical protein